MMILQVSVPAGEPGSGPVGVLLRDLWRQAVRPAERAAAAGDARGWKGARLHSGPQRGASHLSLSCVTFKSLKNI